MGRAAMKSRPFGGLLTDRWLHRRDVNLADGAIPMDKPQQSKPLNDLSRSLTPFDPNHTLIIVIEMGKESWLVGGIIPGVERQPVKKLKPNENELLKLFDRWRKEAEKAGHKIRSEERRVGKECRAEWSSHD